MNRRRRSIPRDFWIVSGVALLVRLAYFFVNVRGNPAFDYLIMDSAHIDAWARAIASGQPDAAVYFRGPLVPHLFALVYKAGGGVREIMLLNHVAGAFTCGMIVLLAREYFARAVALVAGLVAAVYWPLVYFEGEVIIEPIYIALLVLSLWRLARALAHPTRWRLIVAGVCIGLSTLARPTSLVLLPVIPFMLAARVEKGAWLRPSLLVLGACLVVLGPTTIRNYQVGKSFVPVAWSGGLNFYIGNNAESDGRSAMIPGTSAGWMGGADEALAIASEQAGKTLTPAEASSFYWRKGLAYVAEHPKDAAVLNAKKLYMFWEGPERSNEKYVYFFWDNFGLGRVPMPGFWLVSALALAGMIRLWPRRRELSLLYLFVLAFMVGVVMFFVVARYRLPAAPVLIIFASWTAVDMVGALRARRRSYALRMLALVLVLLVAVNASYPDFLSRRPSHITISHYTLAAALTQRGDEDGALRELLAARAAYERAPSKYYAAIGQDIYLKIGALYHQRGDCNQALKALSQIQPNHPNIVEARFLFADCCERTSRYNEAGKAYELMLKYNPNDVRALEGYIRCLEKLGHWEEANEARKRLPHDND